MPIDSSYLFVASMHVDPDHEAKFNEVYDTEHVPSLSEVPGVLSIARFRGGELTMLIGGQLQTVQGENEPKYVAIYELESPAVLVSDAWGEAVERGRWPVEVRPYTRNRHHRLLQRIQRQQA